MFIFYRLILLLSLLVILPVAAQSETDSAAATATPVDMALVFDNSGSMRKADPEFLAVKGIGSLLDGLTATARAALVIFDEKTRLDVPLTDLTAEGKTKLTAGLAGINYKGAYTNSPAAVEQALYELRVNGRKDVNKALVFFTDGIVETGKPAQDAEKARWLREELAQEAARTQVRIYAIAFTDQADFQLIQSLATKTNGEYYRALQAADLADAFSKVAGELAQLTAPAAPPPEAVAEPAPADTPPAIEDTPQAAAPASGSDPAAAAPADDAVAEEQRALEEMARATGMSVEELKNLPEGQALVVPGVDGSTAATQGSSVIAEPVTEAAPPASGSSVLVLVVGALALALVAWLLLRRNKGGAASGRFVPPAAAHDQPEAYLRDLAGNTDAEQHAIAGRPLMLGRIAGDAREGLHFVVVNQSTVGRRHALIEYKDFAYWVTDQGSVNGTFVNGQRISAPQRLKHGDRIRLHKYDFEFFMPAAADAGVTVFVGQGAVSAAGATVMARAEDLAPPPRPAAPPVPPPAPAPAPAAVAEEDDELIDITGTAASPAAAPDMPVPPAVKAQDEEEDMFDVTGVPAAAPATAAEPDSAEAATFIRPLSELPQIKPAAPEVAPKPAPAVVRKPAADDDEEMSLDDFMDTAVMGDEKTDVPKVTPAAAVLSPVATLPAAAAPAKTAVAEEEGMDDRTLMPSQVPAAAKPAVPASPPVTAAKKDDDDPFSEDTTAFVGGDTTKFVP